MDERIPSAETLRELRDALVGVLEAAATYSLVAQSRDLCAAPLSVNALWRALGRLEGCLNPGRQPWGSFSRGVGVMSGWPPLVCVAVEAAYIGSAEMLLALGWQGICQGLAAGAATAGVTGLPDGVAVVPDGWTWPQLPALAVAAMHRGASMLSEHVGASDDAAHGQDFRCVRWCGKTYAFTSAQAACIKILWEAWQHGTPEVGEQTILEAADSQGQRLRDIFTKGKHEAWGRLIAAGETRGTFRLVGKKTG